jgi:hypothetical protein
MPVGSYTNIESRESPLCSIADENETSKLTYKKSVFKKKSTSSTATVTTRHFLSSMYGGEARSPNAIIISLSVSLSVHLFFCHTFLVLCLIVCYFLSRHNSFYLTI